MFLPHRAIARFVFLAAGALGCGPAAATFHLWSMDELYSSADGKVQFLEMTALAPQQEFLSGHALIVTQGSSSHSFTVPNSLPGDSSGHTMIFGTQSFANLGIVQPDIIVPDGFFFAGSATIDWAGADLWSYSGLPSDGQMSLNRNGTTGVNSPRNFAGQTGTVTATTSGTPRNYQGLWYRGEVERGWGVNVAHQGDVLFVTWFTYGADGNGAWYVASDVEKTGADTYTGTLFQTTGPSFDSTPFDPSKVAATQVGSVTLAFSDLNNGTFTYTVNGITQSKPIVRQIFGTHVPTCVSGGTPTTSQDNFQDLWYRSPAESERGWGVNITEQDDILFATWFTYGSDGKGMWLVMPRGDKVGNDTFSGPLFRTTGPPFNASPWDPSKVVAIPAGTATFTFSGFSEGTFAYTVGGVTQSKSITRQIFRTPTVCQ
jgi:hypothetical protein